MPPVLPVEYIDVWHVEKNKNQGLILQVEKKHCLPEKHYALLSQNKGNSAKEEQLRRTKHRRRRNQRRVYKNGRKIGTRKASHIPPQRYFSFPSFHFHSIPFLFNQTNKLILLQFRSKSVRMGSNFRWGQYLHQSSSKCSFQAILLYDSVQAYWTWYQRQSSISQCNPIFLFAFIFFVA